jgi:mono/diheme cytochrome c family protein
MRSARGSQFKRYDEPLMKGEKIDPDEVWSAIRYLDPDQKDKGSTKNIAPIIAVLALLLSVCAVLVLFWLQARVHKGGGQFMERMRTNPRDKGLFPALMTLSAALLIAFQTATAAPAVRPDQSTRNTFNATCAFCHGQSGKGDTDIAKSLNVPDLHSTAVQAQSDAQLRQIITDGRGNMPAFKSSLTAAQIDSLVAYERTLSKQWK